MRLRVPLRDGCAIVGSDAHIWPGPLTCAQRGFIKLARRLRPKAVVLNGDVLDFPGISRHPPIGWESFPDVQDELQAAQEFCFQVEKAAGRARLVWPMGNHDARFETRLASVAREFAGVRGIHLKDHFPAWEPCWSVELGGQRGAVVKHRYKGGIHATHNNTVTAGRTMVTGHLHSLKVTPFTDFNGTRWGVDSGTLSDPDGPQYTYSEDNPRNHRAGFIILTWRGGRLLWPEIAAVVSSSVIEFRGELIHV